MAANSMTGFARAAGASGPWRWAFEVKSVNAKGLDLRLRMPPPFDRVEPRREPARQGAGARNVLRDPDRPARGERQRAAHRRGGARRARRRRQRRRRESRPRAADPGRSSRRPRRGGGRRGCGRRGDGRRGLRRRARSLDQALAALALARRTEGAALAAVMMERLDAIEALTLRGRRQSGPKSRGGPGEACRERGGADGIRPRLRREPAAPGGDPARLQGRHPRGTRPAEDPRRRRPRASGGGRGDRPPARLSRPGVFPRGEHPHRQVQRRQPHRPGT